MGVSVLLLCSITQIIAQSFTAKIEDIGGYYRLSFTVSSCSASNFTPPSLSAFEVLSGPNESTFRNYQIVNGRSSSSESTTYTYILSARQSGRINIGAASVHVGGKTLRSNAISVNAKKGSEQNGSHGGLQGGRGSQTIDNGGVQQAGSAVTQRDLFIDVTPNRTRIREQEAVLLTYRIHVRAGVALSNTSLTQKPDFKGLISQEIPLPGNQIQTTIEHRGGATYRTGTILQYVVFPQKAGRITIPSITFDCAVLQQDHTMDLADAFFNGGGTVGVQVRRKVPEITLQVDALPQPKPANFSGAVGKFNLQGKLLTPNVRTNDVATYRITLNGLGNMKLISAPTVNFPKDFDTYDPKTNEKTETTASGLHGQLTFDYTFVPRNVGDYTIPATDFVFFDTESGTYRTIHTEAIKLHVAKGERSNADVDKQLALLNSDIRALHQVSSTPWLAWGSMAYTVLIVLIVIAFIILLQLSNVWAKKNADVVGRRRRNAGKNTLRRLHTSLQILQGKAQGNFYSTLSQALVRYIADTFNVEMADINTEDVTSLLTSHQIPQDMAARYQKLLEDCQYAQYAPGANNNQQALYEEAVSVIENINGLINRK